MESSEATGTTGLLTVQQMLRHVGREWPMELEDALQPVSLRAGETLFSEGEEGDTMCLLVTGALGVSRRQADGSAQLIDVLGPGDVVGELALIAGGRRTATVYATEDARLLRLSRAQFEALPAASRGELLDLETTTGQRWQRLQLADVLGAYFGVLDARAILDLQHRLEWWHLTNGDVLFRQGEDSDCMYIVVNGRLRFSVAGEGGQETLAGEIGRGETVGEFALLAHDTRSATVSAVRETELARLTPAVFDSLRGEYPELMGRLARVIVQRQQGLLRGRKPVALSRLSLAVVPCNSMVDTAGFVSQLAGQLARFGRAQAFDSRQFDAEFGREGAAQAGRDDPAAAGIAMWLAELEAEHNFLIFATEHEPSAWTRRCIGQADRMLILADPAGDSRPGSVEQVIGAMETPVRTELVFWHPAGTIQPQGTAAWLDARADGSLFAHHHVRQGDRGHMARLARRLTGRAVALVLSGGSARGFAHLGVHQALEELDIPIDYVGGTSMGSIMAGTFAAYTTNSEILERVRPLADPNRIFDRTLPMVSIMESRKVTSLLQEAFGQLIIEDLWVPYFCVAANLTTAEPELYRRGPLWRAVRASISLPAVFAPVMSEGEVLVDGGVMDNFPAQTMAELCESEHIVGVNVSPYREKKRPYDFETSISGWRILFSRLNPFRRPLYAPSLIGLMMRAVEINSVRRTRESEGLVDLLIHPDVREFGSSEYERWAEISRAGYAAALEPLREWWTTRKPDTANSDRTAAAAPEAD